MITESAKFFIEKTIPHNHLLTDEFNQILLLYGYVQEYMDSAKKIEEFYSEVLRESEKVKYGDLTFFYELLQRNEEPFKNITFKMKQYHGLFHSISEMEELANSLLNLINNEFKNMEIKIDFLEYSECFLYYVERIRIHTNMLLELQK